MKDATFSREVGYLVDQEVVGKNSGISIDSKKKLMYIAGFWNSFSVLNQLANEPYRVNGTYFFVLNSEKIVLYSEKI